MRYSYDSISIWVTVATILVISRIRLPLRTYLAGGTAKRVLLQAGCSVRCQQRNSICGSYCVILWFVSSIFMATQFKIQFNLLEIIIVFKATLIKHFSVVVRRDWINLFVTGLFVRFLWGYLQPSTWTTWSNFPFKLKKGRGGRYHYHTFCAAFYCCVLSLQIAECLLPNRSAGTCPRYRTRLYPCAGGPRRWLVAKLHYLPDMTKSDRYWESRTNVCLYWVCVVWTSWLGFVLFFLNISIFSPEVRRGVWFTVQGVKGQSGSYHRTGIKRTFSV